MSLSVYVHTYICISTFTIIFILSYIHVRYSSECVGWSMSLNKGPEIISAKNSFRRVADNELSKFLAVCGGQLPFDKNLSVRFL